MRPIELEADTFNPDRIAEQTIRRVLTDVPQTLNIEAFKESFDLLYVIEQLQGRLFLDVRAIAYQALQRSVPETFDPQTLDALAGSFADVWYEIRAPLPLADAA